MKVWPKKSRILSFLEELHIKKILTFFIYFVCDVVKHELQVASYELRVENLKAGVKSLKARVEIQKYKFKS